MPGLDRLLDDLIKTGKFSPDLAARVQAAMADPARLDEVLTELKTLGADQIGDGPPLEIGDYYRDGSRNYELRWELPSHLRLPISFSDLDRKTQFFVLFQEWSRREMEGMIALNEGRIAEAEAIFDECLARADQIEVDELRARTYEDLRRVAQRRGDLAAERALTEKVKTARGA